MWFCAHQIFLHKIIKQEVAFLLLSRNPTFHSPSGLFLFASSVPTQRTQLQPSFPPVKKDNWKLQSLSRVWLCDPMDCSPPGSSVRGIIPLGALEWAAIPFSRGSSPPGIKPGSSALQADSSPPEALPSYPVSPSRGLYSVGLMKWGSWVPGVFLRPSPTPTPRVQAK